MLDKVDVWSRYILNNAWPGAVCFSVTVIFFFCDLVLVLGQFLPAQFDIQLIVSLPVGWALNTNN